MDYVIGIDSGGTNYRVMACDTRGRRLGYYTGQPASHYYYSREEMSARVNHSLDQCLSQFGGIRQEAKYIVCGTTGLDSQEDGAFLTEFYGSLPGFRCPVKVINDAELAHYTVTGGRGILLISGTGSIGFGRNRAGKTARAGGWLFTICGDEGSGTWVSRQALRHVGRWLDGGEKAGPMVEAICQALKIGSRNDLNRLAAGMGAPPWTVPQLGKLVNEAAGQGDPWARAVLLEAAGHTFALAEDLAYSLELERTEPDFTIGLWGSNILCSPLMLDSFRGLAEKRFPKARIRLPERTAAEGGIDMALELLRGEGTE